MRDNSITQSDATTSRARFEADTPETGATLKLWPPAADQVSMRGRSSSLLIGAIFLLVGGATVAVVAIVLLTPIVLCLVGSNAATEGGEAIRSRSDGYGRPERRKRKQPSHRVVGKPDAAV